MSQLNQHLSLLLLLYPSLSGVSLQGKLWRAHAQIHSYYIWTIALTFFFFSFLSLCVFYILSVSFLYCVFSAVFFYLVPLFLFICIFPFFYLTHFDKHFSIFLALFIYLFHITCPWAAVNFLKLSVCCIFNVIIFRVVSVQVSEHFQSI